MDIKKLYEDSNAFREFVDGYCKAYPGKGKITVEEALTHKVVNMVAEHYVERGNL